MSPQKKDITSKKWDSQNEFGLIFFPMDGFLQWMGSFPILIRLDSEFSEMETFQPLLELHSFDRKKKHPSFECESLVW